MIILWWNKESHFTLKKSNLYNFYSYVDLVHLVRSTHSQKRSKFHDSTEDEDERRRRRRRWKNVAICNMHLTGGSELSSGFALLSSTKKICFLLFNFHSSHRQVACELIHWEKYQRPQQLYSIVYAHIHYFSLCTGSLFVLLTHDDGTIVRTTFKLHTTNKNVSDTVSMCSHFEHIVRYFD